MRIISGTARGSKLATLEGLETRPTLDRVKEPLFSIIQNYVKDAIVLDLFAGSGALGLETLSRGAKQVIFSDSSSKAINVITQNLEKTKFTDKAIVLSNSYEEVLKLMVNEKKEFDIIFLDPPYASGLLEQIVLYIKDHNLLKKDGIIVIETDAEIEIQKIQNVDMHIKDIRKYGRVMLLFLERKG